MTWITDQVTILAEAFGEILTPARLKIYVADLADIDKGRLAVAFARARRELRFFPKISELRDLAGANDADVRRIEAESAWQFALDYLRTHGAERMRLIVGHDEKTHKPIFRYPPPLPDRIDYAVARIGGLQALSQMTPKSQGFLHKDFLEAFDQAPLAESLVPQLVETFRAQQLLASKAEELPALSEHEESDAYEDEVSGGVQ